MTRLTITLIAVFLPPPLMCMWVDYYYGYPLLMDSATWVVYGAFAALWFIVWFRRWREVFYVGLAGLHLGMLAFVIYTTLRRFDPLVWVFYWPAQAVALAIALIIWAGFRIMANKAPDRTAPSDTAPAAQEPRH